MLLSGRIMREAVHVAFASGLEKAFNRNQPRTPKGKLGGGQWVSRASVVSESIQELCRGAAQGQYVQAQWIPMHRATRSEVADIQTLTGMDVSNYEHGIDSSAIYHILKNHAVPGEGGRGQIPVTANDLKLLPLIVAHPDRIEEAGNTALGLQGIRYIKRINGYVIYVEEIRTGRKRLAATTFYKRKSRPASRSPGISKSLRLDVQNVSGLVTIVGCIPSFVKTCRDHN